MSHAPPTVVELPLTDDSGAAVGSIRLATLLGRNPATLAPLDHERERARPSARVIEASEYDFTLTCEATVRSLHPRELLESGSSALAGRFKPAAAVGLLEIAVTLEDGRTGRTWLDVRAAKLEHETEYRQMLADIAEFAVEALLQGFAPATRAFGTSAEQRADLLYRRFALLHHLLRDAELQGAVELILRNPHVGWATLEEEIRPGQPVPAGSAAARALLHGRPRRPWLDSPIARLDTVPHRMRIARQQQTSDTPPNRVVRFVLESWRALVAETTDALNGRRDTAVRDRGLHATAWAADLLDRWLQDPALQEVGRLTSFPAGNQVLLRREGYRELMRAWAVSGTGLDLVVEAADPLYASMRNVATLYEYWAFLQLVAAVKHVCGAPEEDQIFTEADGGLSLGLRTGKTSRVVWRAIRDGRPIRIELFFNRTFAMTSAGIGSWTRALRPDASLHLQPDLGGLDAAEGALDLWVHFDAKYRKDLIAAQFGPPSVSEAEQVADAALAEEAETLGETKRADILKMHAYRDAIRGSAGAYVLFPGDVEMSMAQRAELLPSIGAIPLRPTAGSDEAQGAPALREFVNGLLDHVANQATQHERARFWDDRIYRRPDERLAIPLDRQPLFLEGPPADVSVLLVRTGVPLQLALATDRVPLRFRPAPSNGDLLVPELVLLPAEPDFHTTLVRRAAPWTVAGDGSVSTIVVPVPEAPEWVIDLDLEALARAVPGAGALPTVVTWLQLMTFAGHDR